MSKLNPEFSFRKNISTINTRSERSSSLPKEFTNSTACLGNMVNSLNNNSGVSLNNTSRFEQKKVLRKLREQQVLNRIQLKLKCLNQNDNLVKQMLKFRPVRTKKVRKEKENFD